MGAQGCVREQRAADTNSDTTVLLAAASRWFHRWPLWQWRCGLAFCTALVALALLSHSVAAGEVRYVYDALGRLVAVIDIATNQAALYQYDAVGNLTAIERQSASLVSIIEFNPKSGSVGTAVTIYGTGFSAVAGQNAVSFNGTAATVASATATQIVTSVPSGATTGPISVTAPGGSAVSSASFVVASAGGIPTITSFTPSIGTAGTPVTITGTNFESVPANNHTRFNDVAYALVSSAAPTTISTGVPGGTGSGRLSVTTPAGSAVSTADFFVPPSPYTAGDVEVTGRMAVGSAHTVTFGNPNKIGLVVFDATEGQRLSLGLTAVTIGSGCCSFYVNTLRPDGSTLTTTLLGTSGGVVDLPVLAKTGTYTIFVDPQTTNTGSATVTLSTELTGTLAVDGASYSLSIPQPGRNARLTFSGAAGQRLSLAMTDVTMYQAYVSILKPDGTALVSPTLVNNGSTVFDLPVLPTNGTYAVFVDPYNLNTGNMTLLLSAEVTESVAIDGAATTVSIPRQGQRARLTFDGTAGQRVSLGMSGVTIGSGCCSFYVYIYKPDGTTLTSLLLGTSGGVLDFPVLPTTGTYTLLVDPQAVATGNVTVTLSSEQTGNLTVDGASFPLSISRVGQNARFTFAGTAAQHVKLTLSGITMYQVYVSVLKPDASNLIAPTLVFNGTTVLDLQVLATSGTYTIFVNPYSLNTGNMTLAVTSVSP
jgi:YD repeat-containing protein